MRKMLIAVLMVLLLAMPAFALEEFKFDKSEVVVGVEYGFEEKSMEDLNVLNVGLGHWLDGDLTVVTDELNLDTMFAKLGYQFSEQVTPYALVGMAKLNFDQSLNGSLAIGHHDIGASLLGNEYREMDLAYGVGLMGDLLQVKGIKVGYDVRWFRVAGEEEDESLALLPDYIDFGLPNNLKADYNEVDISTILSKEIALKEGSAVKSITPYLGYRLSMLSLNVKGNVNVDCISIANESNYRGTNHDGLFGAKVKVNDTVSVDVGGVAGQNLGGNVAIALKF